MPEPMLRIQDLAVDYGHVRAVDGLSLAIEPGEVHGLLGPNGAGKTTTLRVVTGFLRPARGRVAVGGVDAVIDSVAARRTIGYLPGDVRFDPRPTGREVLGFLGALGPGLDPTFRDRMVERFQLDLSKEVRAYSKGNRQKLAIVAALQRRPRLALLDEPTSGLDPLMQREFRSVIAELAREGSAVLFSTHVLSEVGDVCHKVAVLRRGRLVCDRPVADLARETVRRVEVVLDGDPPPEPDLGVPGVVKVERRGETYRLFVDAQPDLVIKALARHRVRDVVFERPDIEDFFLRYYPDP